MTASLWDGSLRQFREHLAADTPNPGGGALAAASGTLAAALLRMVCAISRRKASDAEIATISAFEKQVQQCEAVLALCADDDVRAFDAYMRARKTSPDDARRCLLECAEVPLRGAETIQRLMSGISQMDKLCPAFAHSDLVTANALLSAALESLLANVEINLNELADDKDKRTLLTRYSQVTLAKTDTATRRP